jgi:hypothetical protein
LVNEKRQTHLIRLALRELNGKGSIVDILRWLLDHYVRINIGPKKTKYLLSKCADIEFVDIKPVPIYKLKEPKMMLGDVIHYGLLATGSREILAKELKGSPSRLTEWMNGSTRPNENSLRIIDEFVEKYKLFELKEKTQNVN